MERFYQNTTVRAGSQLGSTSQVGAVRELQTYLSGIVWNSFADKFSGCGSSTVGNGLPGAMLVGKRSSIGGGGAVGVGVWVRCSGGVEVRFLLTASTRAARAGSFLFLSIAVTVSVDS